MRKGKYHHYKLALLKYLVDNNFIVQVGEGNETYDIVKMLGIPMSSWYDVIKYLRESDMIIVQSKSRLFPSGILVWSVYEIQLTKEGLGFLTRFGHA